MISINTTRNTVMFVLNKQNRGFISPDNFDAFANLAQLKIFEQLFYDYNYNVNKANRRLTSTEYADLERNVQEMIDIFSVYTTNANFTYNVTTNLWSYTGNDLYRTENLSLVNTTTQKKVNIEQVNKSALNVIVNSLNAAPTVNFPVYVKIGESYQIYPTVPAGYSAEMFYLRKPKYPRWTYNIVQGNPVFNASSPDLQDIELPSSLFEKVVVQILEYAGVSIREQEVVAIANNEETQTAQSQQ